MQKPLNEIQKPLKEKPAYIYKPYKAEAIDKKIKQNIATNIFRKNNISDFDLLDKSRSIFADLNDRLFLSIRVAGKNKSIKKGRIWSIKQSEWLDLQTKNSLFIFAIREEKKYVQLSIEEIENILIDSSFSKGNQYIIKGMVSKNYIEFDYDGEII